MSLSLFLSFYVYVNDDWPLKTERTVEFTNCSTRKGEEQKIGEDEHIWEVLKITIVTACKREREGLRQRKPPNPEDRSTGLSPSPLLPPASLQAHKKCAVWEKRNKKAVGNLREECCAGNTPTRKFEKGTNEEHISGSERQWRWKNSCKNIAQNTALWNDSGGKWKVK